MRLGHSSLYKRKDRTRLRPCRWGIAAYPIILADAIGIGSVSS